MELFANINPVLAVIHLPALPGAPRYAGSMNQIYDKALGDLAIFERGGLDGVIIENFGDKPFFPDSLPAETIAALAAVTREVVKAATIPVGVNALRNDARAALGIATATGARFIRINVHMGAAVADQGILTGKSYDTLRIRAQISSPVKIFADAGVKHATPLVPRGLGNEARELTERGLADALIVSGDSTGGEPRIDDVDTVRKASHLPLFIGSGATVENLPKLFSRSNGFIVGTSLKWDQKTENPVDEVRVTKFMSKVQELREGLLKR